jgi:uncharacterized repeat protein (TIGR03809 family)
MSEGQNSPYDSIARRWLALVERRQEHFIELCDTGRWRHYYTQAEFLDEMRKVLHVRDRWATIAGLPPSGDDGIILINDNPSNGSGLPAGIPVAPWPD